MLILVSDTHIFHLPLKAPGTNAFHPVSLY